MTTKTVAKIVAEEIWRDYAYDDIVGVGLSYDDNGWLVLVLAKPGPGAYEIVPDVIDGVRIRVIETGPFELE